MINLLSHQPDMKQEPEALGDKMDNMFVNRTACGMVPSCAAKLQGQPSSELPKGFPIRPTAPLSRRGNCGLQVKVRWTGYPILNGGKFPQCVQFTYYPIGSQSSASKPRFSILE